MTPVSATQVTRIEQVIRDRLKQQVGDLADQIGPTQDLTAAGVSSIHLIVVLSQMEQELGITFEDIAVAKGHTIRGIALRACAELTPTDVQ